MVDIDERVVQMKFDSSDFEQKSKSTLSILDKLHNALSFKDAASDSSLDAIADNVQKVADKAYTIVDRMIDKIKDNIANKLVAFLQQNTIGQLQAGWGKYADMTTAVATLRGQGYEMSRITDQLERLNYFTDETSFEFTKMVGEIGKFTASGQSLEDATTAMMGIANWAALSGKNAQEASRAMYQLSQALGAGQMRLVDYKSIQNLNMDTIEFRRNAIEAAVAVGTLKDNLNGTWTSLTGKGETFTMNEFADKLTKNAWFNTKVMMATYKKYSEAVDEIRDIYEYGKFFSIDSTEPEEFETTAQAIKVIKQNNEKLVEKFKGKEIDNDEVDILLNRWKKVEIVTDETIDNYAEINKVSKQIAKQTLQKNYLNYIKEYSEVFQGTEEDAKKALNDWHTYVSTYGIKAFSAAQEAKTFKEAIESAKDAASTVWTTIYTNVFGNYEEAKELWTDLANSLYEIFVNRLWDINDVFEYWKTGGRSVLDKQIKDYEAELKALKKKVIFTDEEKERMEFLHQEIEKLNEEIKNTVFINGRTRMFQGIYAFGAGAKSMLFNIRDAWDDITEDNQGGKRLLSFSEKLRTDGLRFYKMMKDLGDTDFYTNIAQSIKNLLAPINGLFSVVASAIGQFLPKGQSVKDTLVMISEKFKDLTERLVPTQETLKRLARILRGVISIFMILVKAAVGLYQKFVGPVLNLIMDALGDVFDLVTEVLADLGDVIFEFEEGLGTMESMTYVGGLLKEVFHAIFDIIGGIIKSIISFLAPAINMAIGLVKKLYGQLKKLFTGNGNPLIALADHFKTLGTRMKEAFFSGESLVDIFNQFREGKGISNFLEMLGTMLDNIIRRIGNTIAAILGLDEAVDSSAIGGALDTFKSVIYNAFTVVAWLYMNVIRPVLATLIVGVANMLRDLGAAVRDGDVKGALALIRDIAKTFTSIGLFKFINTLTKIMGSGGILHVLHNAAKTLKQIWRYFDALALKEFTNALLRLAIVFGIFTGIAVALTFIPTGNLEKAKMLLLAFGAAVAIILLEMIIMVGVSKEAEWALVGLTGAFSSMTALMITFIVGAALFNFALDKMTGGTKDFGEMMIALAKLIAPVIATLLTLVVVFRLLRVLSGGGINVITFGLGFIGIVSAVGTLINAMRTLIDLLNDPAVGPARIAQAMILLTAMFMFISLSARLTGQVMGNNELGVRSGVGQGIAQAILMASLALIIRFVLIPTLESLVDQAAKFPIYAQALIIILSAMVGMAGTVALMGTHLKVGSLNMIAAGVLFYAMAMVMRNILVPLLLDLEKVGPAALSGVLGLELIMLGFAAAIRIILTGVTYLIAAIATVPWRSWLAMIGSIGILVAGVMLISYIFEKNGVSFNTAYLFAALGVVVAIVVAFGLFITVVSRHLNIVQWEMLISIFKWMSIVTLVIIGGITGTAVLIKAFYKDDVASGILVMSKFSEYLLGTLTGIFLLFGAAIWALTTLLKTTSITDVHKLTSVLKLCLHSIEIIIGLFIGNSALAAIMNGINPSSSQAYLDAMSKLMVTAIGTLVTVLLAMGVFVRLVSTGHTNISPNELATISVSLVTLMIIIGEISFLLVPALQKMQGIDWKPIAAMFAGLGFVIIAILGMTAILSKASETMVSVTPILAGMTSLVIGLLAISVMLPLILDAFSKFKDINADTVNNGLKAFLVPFGALVLLITIVATGDLALRFLGASAAIAGGLTLIGVALMAVAVGIAMIKEIFSPGSTWLSNGFNIMVGLASGIDEGNEVVLDSLEEASDEQDKVFKKEKRIKSPSKEYQEYGKMIDLGLARGISKNEKLVDVASAGLAIATNEAFCEELGIASPSKVFYENGRFVVRGFINGMGDETNKNKKAGADMADGFAEGMDKALENAKSEWAGLWDGLDFDEEAEKAGESGAKGFWQSFKESLLGESEDEPVSPFNEGDQKSLDENRRKRQKLFDQAIKQDKKYQEIKDKMAKVEEGGVEAHERYEYEQLEKALAEREQLVHEEIMNGTKTYGLKKQDINNYKSYTEAILALEKKKAGKSKSTIGNWLDSILGGATGEGSNLWNNATGIGNTLVGGIASVFGVNTEGNGDFFSTMKEKISATLEELGLDLTGENGSVTSLGTKITDFFSGGSFLDSMGSAGKKAGEEFVDGMKEEILKPKQGWLTDLLDYISGNNNIYENRKSFETFANSLDKTLPYYEDFVTQFGTAVNSFGDQEITLDEWQEMYKKYVGLRDEGFIISNVKLKNNYEGPDPLGLARLFAPEFDYTYDKSMKEVHDLYDRMAGMIDINSIGGSRSIDYFEFTNESVEKVLDDAFDSIGSKGLKNVADIFTRALNNEDYNYGSNLYDQQIIDEKTGKTGLRLTARGEFLLKEIVKYAKENPDIMEKTISTAFMRDKAYEIYYSQYSSTLGHIKDDVNGLLSEWGFEQEDFNETQINTIMNNVDMLDSFEIKDGHLMVKDDMTLDSLASLLYLVGNISDEILEKKNVTTYEKSKFDQLKESGITLEYLKSLEEAAKNGDTSAGLSLYKITGGKNLTDFMKELGNNYADLVIFMKTTNFGKMNSAQKQYYKDMKDYYETYFGMTEADYSEYIKNAIKLMEQSKNTAEYNESRNNINEWLNSQGKAQVKDFSMFDQFMKDTGLTYTGEQIMKLFQLGLDEGWFEIDRDGKIQADKVTANMVETIRQALGISSPSDVAIGIMKFFMQGFNVGIDENIQSVLDTLTNATDLMTDTTKLGVQAMIDSLDDDSIQPTITPVLDGNGIQNGVAAMNRSFEGVNSIVDATVSSFRDDTVNYNSRFDVLANAINGTNTLVNGLMQMLAEGDIVTVNVTGEVDTNNLYELVVNTNREKFKQTGKNKLMSY